MKISMKLVYQYMAIFFNFSPTSNHLHPLQVENCDSNSRLVVDEDDNGKLRLKGLILLPMVAGPFIALKELSSYDNILRPTAIIIKIVCMCLFTFTYYNFPEKSIFAYLLAIDITRNA